MRISDWSSDVCSSDLQQAFEQVQAALDLLQPVVEAPGDRVGAERQPLGQDRLEVLALRSAVEADDVEVDQVAALQVGGGGSVRNQRRGDAPVVARDHDRAPNYGVLGSYAEHFHP